VFGLWASGDDNPRDDKAKGFDAIFDSPNFGGGNLSYWNSQGLKLVNSNLTTGGSPLADLRTSKSQASRTSSTQGAAARRRARCGLTPKLRAQIGFQYIWLDRTAVVETLLETSTSSTTSAAKCSPARSTARS